MLLRALNDVVAFAIECCMLWAYGLWGWHAAGARWLRWLLMLAAPGLAIVLWAIWGAPKSSTRLRAPALYLFEWAMFAGATAALYAVGRTQFALVYLALASLNLAVSAYFARG